MNKIEIAKAYIKQLAEGRVQKVISLFSDDGTVDSPIYGVKNAKDFYTELSDDTSNSELTIKGIFEDLDKEQIALYFEYKWTVKSGKIVIFDVVDILEFDEANKIKHLKIIYDTVISRKLVEEMKT